MSKGLIYLALGKEYERLSAYTTFYSRRFTELPMSVITNVKDLDDKWSEVDNINFIFVDVDESENREIKTSIIDYTPYDMSFYIDVDAVIQKRGVERIFEGLQKNDICLQFHSTYKPGISGFFNKHYAPVFDMFSMEMPINIYQGGFIGFKKNDRSRYFFERWNYYWKYGLKGRDMPPLSCAVKDSVKNVSLDFYEFNKSSDKIFNTGHKGRDNNFLIQHRWSEDGKKGFLRAFGLPEYKSNKPFDKKA